MGVGPVHLAHELKFDQLGPATRVIYEELDSRLKHAE
jgi:hypothetical protein